MVGGNNGIFFTGLLVMVVVMGAVAYIDTQNGSSGGFTEKSTGKNAQCIDVGEGQPCPTDYAACQTLPMKCCTDAKYCPK